MSGNIIQFPTSQHEEAPTCEPSAGRPGREKVCRRFLPDIDDVLNLLLVLYIANLAGMAAALWLSDPHTALLFALGMLGASIALIGCGYFVGRRS